MIIKTIDIMVEKEIAYYMIYGGNEITEEEVQKIDNYLDSICKKYNGSYVIGSVCDRTDTDNICNITNQFCNNLSGITLIIYKD